jgi:hypothetical protein
MAGGAAMWCSWRSGWLAAASLQLAFALAPPAHAGTDACAEIRAACKNAGFVRGAGASGAGLVKDCVNPILHGAAQPDGASPRLPRVDPRIVSACRAANVTPDAATTPAPRPSRRTEQRTLPIGPTPARPRPTGLVAVLTYRSGQPLSLAAFDNLNISGVALQIHWADIQPTEGDPQWATLDTFFAKASASGKWVQLLVFPGFFTPSWAYPATDSARFKLQYGPGSKKDGPQPLPMPWDTTYQANWLAFMQQVASRYGANPQFAILGAAGPTSVSVETTEPNKPDDRTIWKSMGYTQTRYVGAWNAVLPALAADFPGQFLTIAGRAATDSIVNIDAKGDIVKDFHLGTKGQIVATATGVLGARLGLQNSNLDGSAGGDEPNTDYIVGYAGKVLTGFQLRSSVSGGGMGSGTPAQILKAALDNGTRLGPSGQHVDFIEIYDKDVEDATLQTTLAYGAALLKTPFPKPSPFPRKPCATKCF